MAKWYGDDLRRKLLQAYDGGKERWRKLAQRFTVSVPWAWKISAQRKRSGQMERVEQRRGGGRKVTAEVEQRLRGWVQAQPDLTLAELQQKLEKVQHLQVSIGRLWQMRRQMGLRPKKKSLHSVGACDRSTARRFAPAFRWGRSSPRSRSLARPMRSYRRCRGCAGRSDGTAGPVPSSAGCCSIGSSPAAGRPLTR